MFSKILKALGKKKKKRKCKLETVESVEAECTSGALDEKSLGLLREPLESICSNQSLEQNVESAENEIHEALLIPEVCLAILEWLDTPDLLAIGCVSSYFNALSSEPALWRKKFYQRFPNASRLLCPLSWRTHFLERRNFTFFSTVSVRVQKMASPLTNLRRLFAHHDEDEFVKCYDDIDCGLTAESLAFVNAQIPEIKLTSRLTVFAFYQTASEGMALYGFVVQPLPALAFAIQSSVFIFVNFSDIETRNRWLREMLIRCDSLASPQCPKMSIVLLQPLHDPQNQGGR